jgi:Ca2+-binding RTX toxin-like protein
MNGTMNNTDIMLRTVLILGIISTASIPFPVFSQTAYCREIPATIVGTGGGDTLTGTDGSDVINGLGGDDVINGLGGDDIICGGGGNDMINGGSGNDSVYGGKGNDNLYGNDGNDALFGGDGSDSIDGGAGVDSCKGESLVSCNDSSSEDPDGGNELDPHTNPAPDTTPPTVSITSPSNGATVSGPITISAVASDNVGVVMIESYFDGILIGSDISNTYNVSWDSSSVSNGLHELTVKANDAGGNVGTSIISMTVNNIIPSPPPPTGPVTCQGLPATIIGTEGNDILEGTEGNDVINGLGGNDGITGYGGDDIICGDDGNDSIVGYDGNDILDGGNGVDSLSGNSGDDVLYGGPGDDRIVGGLGNDALYGGDGIDYLNGGADNDICDGEYPSSCP